MAAGSKFGSMVSKGAHTDKKIEVSLRLPLWSSHVRCLRLAVAGRHPSNWSWLDGWMHKLNRSRRLAPGFAAVLSGILCGAGFVPGTASAEPVVHYPGGVIEFSRHCAGESPHRVQAYALFASEDGRAHALLAPWAGYAGISQEMGIGVELQSFALDAGPGWAALPYALQLEVLTEEGRTVTSDRVTSFHGSEAGNPPREQAFVTTAEGRARWHTFVEPDGQEHDPAGSFRLSPLLALDVKALGLQETGAVVRLSVWVHNLENRKEIRMTGPSMRIPPRAWELPPPAFRTLNLAQTFNPLQEGGVFRSMGRAWKYRKCIDERRAAKREFHAFRAKTPEASPR